MVKKVIEILSEADLSRFWYCPKDKTRLQPKLERVAQNPYFKIPRTNTRIAFENAVALRKITPEAIPSGEELSAYIFSHSVVEEAEFVGTECPSCSSRFVAPRLVRVHDLAGVNTGKALYDSQKSLATKNYGRFRTVDRFGLGRQQGQDQTGSSSGFRNLWLLGWIFGFGNLILVLILYYIIGLEMKIGKKFYPIGSLFLIFILVTVLYSLIFFDLVEPLANSLRSFQR